MRLGTLEPEYDRQRHGEGRVPVWWDAGEGSVLYVLPPGRYGLGGFDEDAPTYMAFRSLRGRQAVYNEGKGVNQAETFIVQK